MSQSTRIEQLYKWIDSFQITRQKKNINRDFSDAVPLAEILKAHFPKAVDLHNYTASNSFAQKLDNWRTLQRKILSRYLKLSFTQCTLEGLARADVGIVEKVLWEVKNAIESVEKARRDRDEDVYYVEGLTNQLDGNIVPIKVKQGTKILDEKIVPTSIYNEMILDLRAKDNLIKTLKEKIDHLEQLIMVKDSRIEDLRNKLNEDTGSNANHFLNNIFK